MRHHHDSLHRLFGAAHRAPAGSTEPPFGFETRVLAGWRTVAPEDDSLWMVMLLKRAFVAACVVAFLSVALSYRSLREPVQNELTLADSVIKMTLFP
jgi:hypothetical protein